jgi:hypothetical protein
LRSKVDEILPKNYSAEADEVSQALFALVDKNGNGYASLAEIQAGLN